MSPILSHCELPPDLKPTNAPVGNIGFQGMISTCHTSSHLSYRKVCSDSLTSMDPAHLSSLKSSLPSCSSSVSSMSTSGLGSLHGSSEELSETSDYQRSTPSPRDQDDDLFMGHLIARNKSKATTNFHDDLIECESTKDQGFVDTFVKKKKRKKFFELPIRTECQKIETPKKIDNLIEKSKCGFSPKSFYKKNGISKSDLKIDLIPIRKRPSIEKCSEPPLKVARPQDRSYKDDPPVRVPRIRTEQKLVRCIIGEDDAIKCVSTIQSVPPPTHITPKVISILKTDPKLSNKALVKISKLPLQNKKINPPSVSKTIKCSSANNKVSKSKLATNNSANNAVLNSVTESLISTRVSPVKSSSPGTCKSVWKFGPTSEPPKSNNRSSTSSSSTLGSNISPSKLLRPAVLNVFTSPAKPVIKQESRSTTFTSLSLGNSLMSSSMSSFPSNNPFLPVESFKKSSFLFGGDSDFQSAEFFDSEEIGNVLYIDDDDDDDDDDDESSNEGPKSALKSAPKPPEHIFGSGLGPEDNKEELHSFLFNTISSSKKSIEPKSIERKTIEPKSIERKTIEPKSIERKSIEAKSIAEPTKSSEVVKTEPVTEPPTQICNKLRFPTVPGLNNLIPCKWRDCDTRFTTYGNLSDHLKAVHINGQFNNAKSDDNTAESYRCLWDGCKVFDMVSSSRCWLEKHVPTHGGKYAFACIVSGCKMRFSSQKILQRHVNQHFAPTEKSEVKKKSSKNNVSNFDPYHNLIMRKKVEQTNKSESSKNLRRAGVKLKFRRSVFSARNFDFFDIGIMAGVQDAIYTLEKAASEKFAMESDKIRFQGKIAAIRQGADQQSEALVQWTPKNLLPDEWMPMSKVKKEIWREVKFSQLPKSSKMKISETLSGNLQQQKSETKNRRKSYSSSAIKCPPPPKGLF